MREYIFTNYAVDIQVLTPIHVGMGQDRNYIRGIDFVLNAEKIKLLNNNELFKKIQENDLMEPYLEKLGNGDFKSLEIFIEQFLHHPNVVFKEYPLIGKPKEDIKRQMQTGLGSTIIPGSSLKGALRSILLAHFKTRFGNTLPENTLLGKVADSLLRFVRIGDAAFDDNETSVFITKIFSGDLSPKTGNSLGNWKDKRQGGHSHDFNMEGFESYYEALNPDAQSSVAIQLGTDLPEKLKKYALGKNFKNDREVANVVNYAALDGKNIHDFFAIIQQHTNTYIDKEIAFFNTFKNKTMGDTIIKQLMMLKEINNQQNACVMRVGAGVGFHSITGDWQEVSKDHLTAKFNKGKLFINTKEIPEHFNWKLKDKDPQIFTKTRKIVYLPQNQSFSLMGFVKLSYQTPVTTETPKEYIVYRPQNTEKTATPPKKMFEGNKKDLLKKIKR